MKYLPQSLCWILAFLLFSNNTFSKNLPSYQKYVPLELEMDRKGTFYKRKMEKSQKNGNYEGALCYAFLLSKSEKKLQKKKAEKFLKEHFDNNLKMITESIENLKKQTETFNDELSAQRASRLFCYYKDMITLKQLADEHGGQYKVAVDYTNQVVKAEQVKADYFKKTAQMYFDEVLAAQPVAVSKDDYKPLSRKLRRALAYENRQDISDLYKELTKLATTTLEIGEVADPVGSYSSSMRSVNAGVYQKIYDGTANRSVPFFQLISTHFVDYKGADLVVEIVLGNRNIKKSVNKPSSKTVKKEEDGVVYEVEFITYSKKANATLQGTYIVKERATGKTIYSNYTTGNYTWNEEWYGYRGNPKALGKGRKRLLQQKEDDYPDDTALAKSAADFFAGQVGAEVLAYVRKTFK